jgi:uncharacterized protein
MSGETNLHRLLKTMRPSLQPGEYVFCTVTSLAGIDPGKIIGCFKEAEGITIIVEKAQADQWQLKYSFIAAWITLGVHSSLEAVGLTASFSTALSAAGISCNIVAAYYHDHIFVPGKDAERALNILLALAAG